MKMVLCICHCLLCHRQMILPVLVFYVLCYALPILDTGLLQPSVYILINKTMVKTLDDCN